MLWKTGPSAAELEQVALGWLRQWLGLPEEFFGIIHDTASTAGMHAIIAAREAAREAASSAAELVLYTSEHANLSIDRGALAAGIRRDHIRHIAADDEFRMRPEALTAALEADLAAGRKPFCVVPTDRHHFFRERRPASGDRGDRAPLRSLAPRRRSLCRSRRRAGGIPAHPERGGAGRLAGGESAQVAVHSHGPKHSVYAKAGGVPSRALARRNARLPSDGRK